MQTTPTPASASREEVRERILSLPKRFRKPSADGLVAEWELRVGRARFAVSVADHACSVREGKAESPHTVLSTEPSVWLALDDGRMTGGQAFLERRLAVSGNLDLAMRLQTLFRPYRRARRASDFDQVELAANGSRISCYVLGKGPPVALLHGLGASKITWLPMLAPLAERYRLIVPDLPGHGESDKVATDYSPRYFARVVRHVLDLLQVDRAVVVGNSLGGRVALEMALRSPRRVSALALLSPAVPGFRWRYLVGFTRVVPTEIGRIPLPLRERWMEFVIRRMFYRSDRIRSDAFPVAAREFIRIYQDPAARMAFFATLRHILTERPQPFFSSLRRIRHPALVLLGDRDRMVPPRLGIRLAAHLPRSELVVLPEVGHVPHVEAGTETLEAVQSFLATVAPMRRRP